MQLMDKSSLSRGQKNIVDKPAQARALRQALINIEASKAFVRFRAEESALEFGQMQNLGDLLAVTVDLETRKHRGMPLLNALSQMELFTFVLLGDAGLGKTALARAMASLQCQVRNLPYWIESNTPDSLRQVAVNGFFRNCVPIILDEWRPIGKATFGASGTETMDMLKCLTSVADGATIKCRYSDIKFAPRMPKILTCNCATIEQWMEQITDNVADEDRNAVMRRCLFVEVKKSLIPAARRKLYADSRESELHELQAETLKAQGIELTHNDGFAPVHRSNGTWATMAAEDRIEAERAEKHKATEAERWRRVCSCSDLC